MAASVRPDFSILRGKSVAQIVADVPQDQVEALIKYALQRLSPENVGFLFAVQQYRRKAKHEQYLFPVELYRRKLLIPQSEWGGANTMGNWIYQTYIPDSAEFQINIKSETRSALDKIAGTRSTPFIPPDFDDAFTEIAGLVDSDWLANAQ